MFQAIEKIIACMALGHKASNSCCNFSQLDGFGTTGKAKELAIVFVQSWRQAIPMRRSEKDKAGG
jgi:hypothetical protein